MGKADMQPSLASLYLYGVRKTAGFGVLVRMFVRAVQHRFSAPPIAAAKAIPNQLARLVQRLIYLRLTAIPNRSWIASSATGWIIC